MGASPDLRDDAAAGSATHHEFRWKDIGWFVAIVVATFALSGGAVAIDALLG